MELLPPIRLQSPKSGNRPDECEDEARAVYPARLGHGEKSAARFAIADGASESAFARSWAQIIAGEFVVRPPDLGGSVPGIWEQWLVPCQKRWNRLVPWASIPWHGETKTRAGAMTTLLGITLFRKPGDSGGLHWRAAAVGDSCLFMVRQGELLLCFPLDDAAHFNNAPDLICSNPVNNGPLENVVQYAEGACQPGDVIILASDALASWFLKQHAAEEKPWETILNIQPARWDSWVQDRRKAGSMRNDDTTLIIAHTR